MSALITIGYFAFAKNFSSDIRVFILANYIFLGDEERKKFAQISHEYLIDQVQRKHYVINHRGTSHFNMKLLHPVKEVVWFLQLYNVHDRNDWYNFTKIEDLYSFNYYFNTANKCKTKILWDEEREYYESKTPRQDTIERYIEELIYDTVEVNFNYENANMFKTNFYSILKSAKMMFNGHDRFSEQDAFAALIKNSLFLGSFPSTISKFKLDIKKEYQTYCVDT